MASVIAAQKDEANAKSPKKGEPKMPGNIFDYVKRCFSKEGLFNSIEARKKKISPFDNIWTVKAIFQSLSETAQQYILRMVIGGAKKAFTSKELVRWVATNTNVKAELDEYKLIVKNKMHSGLYRLEPRFAKKLRIMLCLAKATTPFEVVKEVDKREVHKLAEKRYRGEQGVITYLLSDQIDVEGQELYQKEFPSVSLKAKTVLDDAKLIVYRCVCHQQVKPDARVCNNPECGQKFRPDHQRYDKYGRPDMLHEITGTGLNFILKSDATQAWAIVLSLLEKASTSVEDTVSLLNFFFSLAYCLPGQAYKSKKLNSTQKECLRQLYSIGFVVEYQEETEDGTFLPSHFIINMPFQINLSSKLSHMMQYDGDPERAEKKKDASVEQTVDVDYLRIVVETNFKVYAYTPSVLEEALLKQFVVQRDRLPNLLVGHIEQDQMLQAFRKGITPDQIIRFLEDHAHPCTIKVGKEIPRNVDDQIHLWYREQELVVAEEVDVYIDFDGVEEYNAWVRFADEQEILKDVYQNKNNERTVIVEGGTYSMMKEFSKKRKQKPEEQPMIVDSGEESDDNMADLDELDMKA